MKTFLSAVLLFSVGISVNAQSNRFEAGFEGGPGISTMRGNPFLEENHHPGFGFSGALFFQVDAVYFLSFRTNLAYERKGTSWSGPMVDDEGKSLGTATLNYNYDYLTVPLLVRATFGEKVKFFVNVGPYFSCLVSHTVVVRGDQIKTSKQKGFDFFKPYDTGMSFGAGLAIPIRTKLSLNFEVRNNLGLYNISDLPISNDGTVKHNSTNLLVGVGYRF